MKKIVGVHEKLSLGKTIPLSLQHLMAMFGATILVPLIVGVNPAICLLMNGIGTIIYSIITKGKIPAYLGSSFAFIAPALIIINSHGGYAHAQSGFIFFGIFFVLVSIIVKFAGTSWINIIMPPAVMGAVVAVIGLELAPVSMQWAGLVPAATPVGEVVKSYAADYRIVGVAIFTLCVTIFGAVLFKGFMKVIPILIGVVCGYIASCFAGLVSFESVIAASWFQLPKFTLPIFDLNSVVIILPACIVVLAEHVGHLIVTGNVIKSDLIENPGLSRSLFADGITNIISGFTGSTPNTTYGENIGVMAITKVYSVYVIRGAAIIAIIFSCIGKVSALIGDIPKAVMGGVTIYLYGVIAISGIRMLVEQRVDFSKNYNLTLGAITFIVGVSGASINIGSVQLSGMALSAFVGVALSLIFYTFSKIGLMNEKYVPNEKMEDIDLKSIADVE